MRDSSSVGDAFHLDDVGAHVGEHRAAPGTGDDAGEIDDADAVERADRGSHGAKNSAKVRGSPDATPVSSPRARLLLWIGMRDLRRALTERILVLDGAMGTMIQAANLSAEDFGGAALEGCNEHLNLTRPDVIRGIHAAYFDAGADLRLDEHLRLRALRPRRVRPGRPRVRDLARRRAPRARKAAGDEGRGRFVIGAMGPSTRSISVTRNVTFDEVMDGYEVQAAGLIAGGVDALLLETQQDTLNVKAAAHRRAEGDAGSGRRAAADGERHHRADRDDAGRPGRGGALRGPRAPRRSSPSGSTARPGPSS